MYGHIESLAKAELEGLKKAGIEADLYQIPETLPEGVLAKVGSYCSTSIHIDRQRTIVPNNSLVLMNQSQMHAPPKSSAPIASADTLTKYDAFLFGIPTRYGNFPGQWKAFWDTTGGLWASGALHGKYAGMFVSTATPGGGQESTFISAMSTLAHHGIIYVPLGYKSAFPLLANLTEVHGGSPWGAGTFAVSFSIPVFHFHAAPRATP
jgi:NAD(P)H dehydrogenase (quinone)